MNLVSIFLTLLIATPALGLEQIPKFELQALSGERFKSEQNQEKPTVYYFWATWCKCCKQSWRELNEISKRYGEKVRIKGITVVTPEKKARTFAKRNEIPSSAVLLDDGTMMERFKIDSIPTTLLAKDGKVLFQYQGPMSLRKDDLEKRIKKEL